MQIDKLFQQAVGLKISYLINSNAIEQPLYISELTKRFKAVSSDVVIQGSKLADVVFEHGHRLEHVFYSSPFRKDVPQADMEQVLAAMLAVDFKGKLILSESEYNSDL